MESKISPTSPNIFLCDSFIKEFSGSEKASVNNVKGRINNIVYNVFVENIEKNDEFEFVKKVKLALADPKDQGLQNKAILFAHKYFQSRELLTAAMQKEKLTPEAILAITSHYLSYLKGDVDAQTFASLLDKPYTTKGFIFSSQTTLSSEIQQTIKRFIGLPEKTYRFIWKDNEIKAQYQTLQNKNQIKVRRAATDFKEISSNGGAVNVGFDLQQADKNAKIGIMIAANSGLPGGTLGKRPDKIVPHDLTMKTQEESIWADVVLTTCGTDPHKQKSYYDDTIGNKWGLPSPEGSETMTIQGIDFTKVTDATDYNGVFVLKDCTLSALDEKKNLKSTDTYRAAFVFADSINANPMIGAPTGTMQRTLNQKAINDYSFFCECIKEKLRSSLDAMVKEGVTHPLIARISCGIYAPDHFKKGNTNITQDFYTILQEVLNEQVGPNGEKRGQYFQEVIIPQIKEEKQ